MRYQKLITLYPADVGITIPVMVEFFHGKGFIGHIFFYVNFMFPG